jgi:hypothetical protein
MFKAVEQVRGASGRAHAFGEPRRGGEYERDSAGQVGAAL